MRKLGIDLGLARIGLAVSDPLGIFASAIETYNRKGFQADIDHIVQIVKEHEVDTIVLGLPINMDGTYGVKCQETYDFADALKLACNGVEIVFQDERLTTVSAQRMLIEADVKRKDRKQIVDKVAASIILQNYLDRKGRI